MVFTFFHSQMSQMFAVEMTFLDVRYKKDEDYRVCHHTCLYFLASMATAAHANAAASSCFNLARLLFLNCNMREICSSALEKEAQTLWDDH